MAGAIGLAFGRREPAISEISASRIAERPPAGGFANVLETQPQHLSDLGFAIAPRRPPPLPGRETASGGGVGALVIGVVPRVMSSGRPLGATRARRRRLRRGGAPSAATELDPDPARLADDRVSGSHAKRHSDVACALAFMSKPLEVFDGLGGPQHLRGSNRCRCGVPSRAEWVKVDILFLGEQRDVAAPIARLFWTDFQFLQHLKKTNQIAISYLE
jgi:hypothetical protein